MEECNLKFVGGINPLIGYLGQILYCKTKAGRTFTTRLVGVNGHDLIFETRSGQIIINQIEELAYVTVHEPKEAV